MKKIALFLLIMVMPALNVFASGGNPPAPGGFGPPPAMPINQDLILLFFGGVSIFIWQLKLKNAK